MLDTPVPRLAILLALAATTPGCAPLVVGGAAAGAAMVSQDPRSSGAQVDDQMIELKAYDLINHDPDLVSPDLPSPLDPNAPEPPERSHIAVTSYNGVVLLTGEVPTESARTAVVERVHAIEKVKQVQDELSVGPPASPESRSSDSLLATMVRARLLLEKDFDSDAVKVVTSEGTVYLIGLVSRKEAATATEIARTTQGARRVVKLFQYHD